MDFTHFNDEGRARMVDVSDKDITERVAVAEGRVVMAPETLDLVKTGGHKKGDVLTTAQIAGVMGAKQTSNLVPMCHPLLLDKIDLKLWTDDERSCVWVQATVKIRGRTGVEMEALTGVSVACLTIYDMCKAIQKDMEIKDIRLVSKTGGVHGDFRRHE